MFTFMHLDETVFLQCIMSQLTIYGTCNVTSRDKCFVLLHSYFLKYVPSAQHDYFL